MAEVVLIIHNVRSAHNVGSIFRTADGLGVSKLYLTGYTPYPQALSDTRLPHIAERAGRQIHKTALGAEKSVDWEQVQDPAGLLRQLHTEGYFLAALEQAGQSIPLESFKPPTKLALMVGSEIGGIEKNLLSMFDIALEIPMAGKKESFNVAVAAAIAVYRLRRLDK